MGVYWLRPCVCVRVCVSVAYFVEQRLPSCVVNYGYARSHCDGGVNTHVPMFGHGKGREGGRLPSVFVFQARRFINSRVYTAQLWPPSTSTCHGQRHQVACFELVLNRKSMRSGSFRCLHNYLWQICNKTNFVIVVFFFLVKKRQLDKGTGCRTPILAGTGPSTLRRLNDVTKSFLHYC